MLQWKSGRGQTRVKNDCSVAHPVNLKDCVAVMPKEVTEGALTCTEVCQSTLRSRNIIAAEVRMCMHGAEAMEYRLQNVTLNGLLVGLDAVSSSPIGFDIPMQVQVIAPSRHGRFCPAVVALGIPHQRIAK